MPSEALIPEVLYSLLKEFIDQAKTDGTSHKKYEKTIAGFKCMAGFGKGQVARVPWFDFFGKNQEPTNGIYPVCLYYKNDDLLIIAYGISEIKKPSIQWGVDVTKNLKVHDELRRRSIFHKYKNSSNTGAIYGDSYVKDCIENITKLITPKDDEFCEIFYLSITELFDKYAEALKMNIQSLKDDKSKTPQIVQQQVLQTPALPSDASIQDVFRALCEDTNRNIRIAEDVWNVWRVGRKILVLTERTSHLETLRELLAAKGVPCHILHGRLSRKQRTLVLEELKAMPDATARVILATGRLIGEGFDHSPLNTMVLAMPISWQGTLQQYAGRLHRVHADKIDIRIYDYVERDNMQLHRMWKKRRAGYVAMGYQIIEDGYPDSTK